MPHENRNRRDPQDGWRPMNDVLTPTRPARPAGPQPVPDARRPAKPGQRPRPGSPSLPPKSPVRPASPVRPPGPGRSGRPAGTSAADRQVRQQAAPSAVRRTTADRRPAAGAGQAGQTRRTSFVLLLLGLLGGGLVCLLVVNTTLAANSIRISNLQKTNALGSQQVQELQQQVAAARSAGTIAKEARRLGMRPDPELVFIDLRTNRIEAPRGAAAAALAARLADGWPGAAASATGGQSGERSKGNGSKEKKSAAGRPGQ